MTRLDRHMQSLWASARRVAFAVLAGLLRRHSAKEIERRISTRPVREQTAIVLAVLAGLLLTSLLFAQAGAVGLLIFLLLVIFLIQ